MPDSNEHLQRRTAEQIEASENRCVAAKKTMKQNAHVMETSRKMIADSKAQIERLAEKARPKALG
jgi:hypothetical protein